MADWFNPATWLVLALFSTVNLLVLLSATENRIGRAVRRRLEGLVRRVSGQGSLGWLDWPLVAAGVAIAFGSVAAFGILSGQYACYPRGIDAYGLFYSGRALWTGSDPFLVTGCSATITEPYGLLAIVVSAIGSLGGIAGIYAIWGAVAVAVVPLVWKVAGADRRFVVVYVATSALFVPIVVSQIDGATNAIVPVTVLGAVWIARRRPWAGAVIGGVLSTARFPTLFPVLGATGSGRGNRYGAFVVAAASFLIVTGLTYLVWRSEFLDPVFLSQIGRRSFSLNWYGILLLQNALPSSSAIEAVQATLTLALVLVVFVRGSTPIGSAALVLAGVALLNPFLSFTILVWLLPVALTTSRARWWLWGVALVGSLNYDLALNVWAWQNGILWPSELLDGVLTVLLLGVFVELCRSELTRRAPRLVVPRSENPT
jgi:hypothetical protein